MRMSTRELYISKILLKLNLEFEFEKKFDDCKNITHLRFDFYVPELNCCIEYDGIHHFLPQVYWDGARMPISKKQAEKNFIEQKQRDRIKNDFCESNGITLIRLSFKNYKMVQYKLEEMKNGKIN